MEFLEPRYIEYDEIKRRGMLSGKPSADTDHVHDGILNVAPATNCDVKEEEEEGGQRKRTRTGSDSECCAVCLDEFTTGEYAAEMPCSHVFHRQCIESWLRLIHHCPICQFEMPLAYDDHDDTDLQMMMTIKASESSIKEQLKMVRVAAVLASDR